tara:strand:+ start:40 stop:408 length:369 start_codon:yes stop_codon:yes gene_type:complete
MTTLRQVILFEGLQKGGVSPSDIDAILELHDNYLILFEVKKVGVEIPKGQRNMLETIVDVWGDSGRIGLVVKATHNVKNTDDILLKDCEVAEVYYKDSWKIIGGINVKEFLDNFYKKNNIKL